MDHFRFSLACSVLTVEASLLCRVSRPPLSLSLSCPLSAQLLFNSAVIDLVLGSFLHLLLLSVFDEKPEKIAENIQ